MKINRIALLEKYDKRCAYCGRKITNKTMQIDHIYPKSKYPELAEDFNNLNPSCKRCNFYKSARSLEHFRQLLLTIQNRLNKIFIFRIAVDYGIIKITKWSGKFYFETFERKKNGN